MDDKNGKNPLMAISAMVALFTALGVIVYVQAPLKGIRPSTPEIQERSQTILARLWQDPFQAVLDQAKTRGAIPPKILCVSGGPILVEIAPLQQAIQTEDELNREKITILGIMVFGAPYVEEMEQRLRRRYAVLSGLCRLGFIPEDAEHLGFVRIFRTPSELEQTKGQISLSTILPFERLVSGNHKESVLLLWLNDDVFQENPLERLAFLISQLRSQAKKAKLEFKVIGPAGSTTLLEMLKEIQNAPKSQESPAGAPADLRNLPSKLEGLEIYSATATAAASILLQELQKTPGGRLNFDEKAEARIAAIFSDCGITFRRVISSDHKLAKELIKELELRGVKPSDHLALIAEWDTFYGRSLPQTFKEAWKDWNDKYKETFWVRLSVYLRAKWDTFYGHSLPQTFEKAHKETRVHLYTYLRAIDGQLPGEREAALKGQQKSDADRKDDKDIQKMEDPTGTSQYDYLRRLAEMIYRQDQERERQGKGRLKAIGVLGSDFYDKYLVL